MDELIKVEEGTAIIAPDTADKIAQMQKLAKKLDDELKEIKARLYEEMKEKQILKIETPTLTVSFVEETTTESLDSKALKKDLPEIFNTYSTEKTRAGYVKLTAREADGNMEN